MLRALSRIIDPDFGMDIVACGFVKDLAIDGGSGRVTFRLELTTPACPIKDEFERKVRCESHFCELCRALLMTDPFPACDAFEVNMPTYLRVHSSSCSTPCTRVVPCLRRRCVDWGVFCQRPSVSCLRRADSPRTCTAHLQLSVYAPCIRARGALILKPQPGRRTQA